MLAEDHGDELGRFVLRSKKNFCSRTPLRRSAKNGTVEDLVFISTSLVAKKRKIRASTIQIEREADELYCGG
jgi:hypothetical protein